MRLNIFIIILMFLSVIACKYDGKTIEKLPQKPQDVLSVDSIENFKYNIIRYMGKMHPKARYETRFDTVFDGYYKALAQEHDWMSMYYDTITGDIYFLMNRIAPSLKFKKVAIGGKLRYNDNGELDYYEENFRTWKMLAPELEKKSIMLFTRYINGEELSPYLTKNSKGEEYIEFPDDIVQYDVSQRKWVTGSLSR